MDNDCLWIIWITLEIVMFIDRCALIPAASTLTRIPADLTDDGYLVYVYTSLGPAS